MRVLAGRGFGGKYFVKLGKKAAPLAFLASAIAGDSRNEHRNRKNSKRQANDLFHA